MRRRALTWALAAGIRKGVVGGSGPWLVVAVAIGAVRFLNRPEKGAGGHTTLHLEPGDRYTIVCAENPRR